MNKFYICTAIAYVNGAPHVGHAMEFVQADVLARYHRLKGDDVFYLTGTDEHGSKIYEKAQEEGVEVQEFVDKNAKNFEELDEKLNISYDAFVRTSSEDHKEGAAKMWMKMVEAGDIYKGSYKGNYCLGCEAFIPDKDLDEDGNCAIHKNKPRVLEEENYFFKLSKYSDRIKAAIQSGQLEIVPENRKKEMLNIIGEDGLHDVSFSRPKDALPWGVSVPNDDSQVMYVWGDALTNYITGIGYAKNSEDFAKYWPCDVQLIGKDILRFHAGIWIGMLMSAEMEIPKSIYVHGFITSEGEKMSKSLGNVIDPVEYLEKYGTDPVRYFLMREIPTTDDGDFSQARFEEVYNTELANGVGNLLNRVVMMVDRYLDGVILAVTDGEDELAHHVMSVEKQYDAAMMSFNLKVACEKVLYIVDLGNKYIDEKKPWVMAKENDENLAAVLYNLLELLRHVAVLLNPFVPETSEKMAVQLGIAVEEFKMPLEWGTLKEGHQIYPGNPLFPRLEG